MKNIYAKTLTIALLGIIIAGFSYQQVQAQFSIGASYEIRKEKPTNGFGIRIENDLPLKLPLVAIGIRAQFSNFSEKNSVSGTNVNNVSISYDRKLNHYNLGLMALGKLKLGLLSPYIGLGIGTSHLKVKNSNLSTSVADLQSGSKSNNSVYYEGAIGASATLLPMLHPFIEYRLQKDSFKNVVNGYETKDSSGLWAFGISLSF